MRADYDSQGKTIQIELIETDRLTGADDHTHPAAVVGLVADEPALIDILDVSKLDEAFDAIASRYSLDADTLSAIAHAALRVPDRRVELEVAAGT